MMITGPDKPIWSRLHQRIINGQREKISCKFYLIIGLQQYKNKEMTPKGVSYAGYEPL